VAGGDGTVMEVVTGLMRREDRDTAAKVPIGILPVGKNNLTAKGLFPGVDNQVRLLGEATMAVVRQLRRPTGVMEVENQTVSKSIYAMNQLDMGAWKDTRLLIDKWFLSFDWMKRYIPQALYGRAYLTKHKDLTLDCNLELKYQERVEGDHQKVDAGYSEGGSGKGGQGLFSWFGGQKVESKPQTTPSVLHWKSKEYHGSGLAIEPEEEGLKASLAPSCLSLGDFTSHGASLLSSRSANHPEATNITSPTILISPIDHPGSMENQDKKEGEEGGRTICVDGDDIEFSGPLLVTYLRDRLSLFCSKTLVKEEISTATVSPQRWSSVSNLSLARRAKIN